MTGNSTKLAPPRSQQLLLLSSSRRWCSIPRSGLAASTISNVGTLVTSKTFAARCSVFARLNTLGYRIGTRVLELMVWRAESTSKTPKREIRFLPALMSIHTQLWRAVFGKPADAIEKSVENADECTLFFLLSYHCRSSLTSITDMIIDNDPPIERHISIPRDMSQLSCSSFTAGIVEAVLDGLGFVCFSPLDLMPKSEQASRPACASDCS
jgi:hypothetical protein